MKKIKTFLAYMLLITSATLIISCKSGNNSTNDNQSNNTTQPITNDAQTVNKPNNFKNEYKLKDGADNLFTLSLNTDGSVTLSGNGYVFYGSWRKNKYNDMIHVDFSTDPTPSAHKNYKWIVKHGEDVLHTELIMYPVISDGYLYYSVSDADAKNPNHRFKLE